MASEPDLNIHGRLLEHIAMVSHDQNTPIDLRLFDQAQYTLPNTIQKPDRIALVQALALLLQQLQQDATPVANLLARLIEPFTYADILSFAADSFSYVDGLTIGDYMASINHLTLAILEKATIEPTDAAHVASMLDTMLALMRLWLRTPDAGVASRAAKLLINLLKIDQEIPAGPDSRFPSGGQGLVWKRIFGDRDVYRTFFEVCALSGPSKLKLSRTQRTLAQGRLMDWLPAIGGMNWSMITRTHHPEIEESYHFAGGLLGFATIHMVEYQNDMLMYRCLLDFYTALLTSQKPTRVRPIGAQPSGAFDSPALLYLIAEGIHARTVAIYLQVSESHIDPVHATFTYGPAANYVATYASIYPDHFLASQMPTSVNDHLLKVLERSPARWAHDESPKHDLHVIASLPRQALLPGGDGSGDWHTCPLSVLPSRATNTDVLHTLATVFQGPARPSTLFPPDSKEPNEDFDHFGASAARALYYHYLGHNARFWDDIADHADTVALKEMALAAVNTLSSVIRANWSTRPGLVLPTNLATPDQPYVAMIAPPALEYTLPYLLRPPKTFANLVGGRGDAESAAYQIAAAKFDCLRALHRRLMEHGQQVPDEGYDDIVMTLGRRLAQGPMSREGQVGGSVGTLEL